MNNSIIFYAARTPITRLCGAFQNQAASHLGAELVKASLKQHKLDPKSISEIIMGQVLTAGCGQAPARQTALLGGLSSSCCATTINRVCGSGLKAILDAHNSLQEDQDKIIFAGGQENMSMAPHLLLKSRLSHKYGKMELLDHIQIDGLYDPYDKTSMGECAEICAKEYKITREEQDSYAVASYKKALKAQQSLHFAKEIVPVKISSKKETITVLEDEEPKAFIENKLQKLAPAFIKDGTITAGNASSINDGAALVCVTSPQRASQLNIKPLAKIIATDSFAQEPNWFTTSPIHSIKRLLKKAGLSLNSIDIFEINEAFSLVPIVAQKELNIPFDKLNPYGGAVSLGHPIGASGARIVVSLINGLITQNKKYGIASICIGGGEASSILIEAL